MKTTYGTMYYVDDMKKTVDFYKKTFGFTPQYESEFWTEFQMGEHRLCLHAKDPSKKYDANGVLILNHDGIKSLYDSMKKDGYNVFGLHEVHGDMWSFHFRDTSNNELSYYGKS